MESDQVVRLKASSLLEATIALTVITIVFSLGWMTINHVMDSSPIAHRSRADRVLEVVLEQTEQQSSFFNEEIKMDGYLIKKVVRPHPEFEGVYILSLQVLGTQGQLISEKQKLFKWDETSMILFRVRSNLLLSELASR